MIPSPPLFAGFWIAQADLVYAVVSTTGLLLIVWLVLRPR
jgi:hypothetical protein